MVVRTLWLIWTVMIVVSCLHLLVLDLKLAHGMLTWTWQAVAFNAAWLAAVMATFTYAAVITKS